jgi:hypothetical protein
MEEPGILSANLAVTFSCDLLKMSIEKAGNNISVRPGSTSLHIVNKQNRR